MEDFFIGFILLVIKNMIYLQDITFAESIKHGINKTGVKVDYLTKNTDIMNRLM